MKIFFDLLPAILFFTAYKLYDMYVATAVLMATVSLQLIILRLMRKQIENMHKIMFWGVMFFGCLTLFFQNDAFIKWKVTIVNWIIAGMYLGSQFVGKDPFAKHMLSKVFSLSDALWKQVNLVWVAFFIVCGALNLLVAFTCSNDTWMNFKLFGLTGLTLLFLFGHMFSLRKYIDVKENVESEGSLNE